MILRSWGRTGVRSAPLFPSTLFCMATAVAEAKTASKPVKTIHVAGISASIFANKSKDGELTFHKATFQRVYKSGNDWEYTSSFGRNDLPKLKLAVQRVWEEMLNMKG